MRFFRSMGYMVMAITAGILLTFFVRMLPEVVKKAREGQKKSREAACQVLLPQIENRSMGSFPHPAPKEILLDEDGHGISLDSLAGNVVMLHFFATSCPDCIKQRPALESIAKDLQGKPFTMLAMSTDEKPEQIPAAFQHHPWIRLLFDKKKQAMQQYGVDQLPQTFLIDKKGNIRYSFVGYRQEFSSEVGMRCIESLMIDS